MEIIGYLPWVLAFAVIVLSLIRLKHGGFALFWLILTAVLTAFGLVWISIILSAIVSLNLLIK